MVWVITCMCSCMDGLPSTNMDAYVPKNIKKARNGKWGNAIPNNYNNAYENWKGKCRNYTRMAREIFKYI